MRAGQLGSYPVFAQAVGVTATLQDVCGEFPLIARRVLAAEAECEIQNLYWCEIQNSKFKIQDSGSRLRAEALRRAEAVPCLAFNRQSTIVYPAACPAFNRQSTIVYPAACPAFNRQSRRVPLTPNPETLTPNPEPEPRAPTPNPEPRTPNPEPLTPSPNPEPSVPLEPHPQLHGRAFKGQRFADDQGIIAAVAGQLKALGFGGGPAARGAHVNAAVVASRALDSTVNVMAASSQRQS